MIAPAPCMETFLADLRRARIDEEMRAKLGRSFGGRVYPRVYPRVFLVETHPSRLNRRWRLVPGSYRTRRAAFRAARARPERREGRTVGVVPGSPWRVAVYDHPRTCDLARRRLWQGTESETARMEHDTALAGAELGAGDGE